MRSHRVCSCCQKHIPSSLSSDTRNIKKELNMKEEQAAKIPEQQIWTQRTETEQYIWRAQSSNLQSGPPCYLQTPLCTITLAACLPLSLNCFFLSRPQLNRNRKRIKGKSPNKRGNAWTNKNQNTFDVTYPQEIQPGNTTKCASFQLKLCPPSEVVLL